MRSDPVAMTGVRLRATAARAVNEATRVHDSQARPHAGRQRSGSVRVGPYALKQPEQLATGIVNDLSLPLIVNALSLIYPLYTPHLGPDLAKSGINACIRGDASINACIPDSL